MGSKSGFSDRGGRQVARILVALIGLACGFGSPQVNAAPEPAAPPLPQLTLIEPADSDDADITAQAMKEVLQANGLASQVVIRQLNVSGTIRLWGSNYITDGNLGRYWEEGFRKFHPGVKLSWHMKTTEAAVPSLVFGVSDIGIGRKLTFSELQLFQRYKDRSPLEIDIATGSYDVPGWNPGFGVIVSKDNPLTRITMQQLDGIFGAERAGGWDGTSWVPTAARGPEQNIRTWGQLGLTGEWADKPINVYGLNLRYHQATEISDMVLKSSDKWNEKLRTYANYVTQDGKLSRGMNQDLAQDKFGIGIVAAPTTNLTGGKAEATQKILPLALTDAGPYVPYTLESIQDRSYPMYDHIFAYADLDPHGTPDAKVIEFLRYIVSRQGQEAVMRDGKYLPLSSTVAKQEIEKLW